MRRTIIVLTLIATLLMVIAPVSHAQQDESSIPLYVRFCNFTREQTGDETITRAIEEAANQFADIETFLDDIETGHKTFLEAISGAEEAISAWDGTQKLDCLAPLNAEVTRALQEILVAMLYGQLTDPDSSATHLQTARNLIDGITTKTTEAISYLTNTPIAELEATPEATETAAPDGAVRSSEELSALLSDFLTQNGVTVLVEAGVQAFPDNTLIVVQLNRFTSNGQDFDYDNTLFTFDVISRAVTDWPEVAEISRIAVETYDGTTRSLYAETTGEDFRAYYFDQSMSGEEFVNRLVIQLPE